MLNIVEVPQRHTKHIGLVVSPNDATTAILIGGGCEDETVPFSLFLAPVGGVTFSARVHVCCPCFLADGHFVKEYTQQLRAQIGGLCAQQGIRRLVVRRLEWNYPKDLLDGVEMVSLNEVNLGQLLLEP